MTKSKNLLELCEISNEELKKMDSKKLIEITNENIVKINSSISIKNFTNKEEVVVFLGNTGAGKTTLINYLTSNYGKIDYDNDNIFINFDETNDALEVSSTNSSCTFVPQIKISYNRTYVDIAGLRDNRSFFVNISNGLFFNGIIRQLEKIKFCLVVEYSLLTIGKGGNFISFIENIFKILGDIDIDKIPMIINKVDSNLSIEQITNTIGSIKNTRNKDIEQYIKNLVKNKKITIFRCPEIKNTAEDNNKGLVYNDQKNTEDIDNLNNLIDKKTKGINSKSIKLWPVNQTMLSYIFTTYNNILNLDMTEISKEFCGKLLKLNGKIAIDAFIKEISDKKNEMKKLEIIDTDINTIYEQLKVFSLEDTFYNLKDLNFLLSNKACLKIIQKKILGSLRELQEKMDIICNYINNQRVTIISSKKEEKVVFCNYLEVDQEYLNKLIINTDTDNIKSLKLYATNYIILKDSIKLSGINFSVISPNLVIKQPLTIDLSGQNASHYIRVVDGDGAPGLPGKSSGNLLLVYNKSYDLSNLTVSLFGGKGGNGQNGANGKNGTNGENAEDILLNLYSPRNSTDSASENTSLLGSNRPVNKIYKIKEVLNSTLENNNFSSSIDCNSSIKLKTLCCFIPRYNIKVNKFIIEGTPATVGSDGFKGGIKGLKGNDGKIKILTPEENNQIKTESNIIKYDNIDGEAGEGGEGGFNGKNYEISLFTPERYYNFGCSISNLISLGILPLCKYILETNMKNEKKIKVKNFKNNNPSLYVNGKEKEKDGESPKGHNKKGLSGPELIEPIGTKSALEDYKRVISKELSMFDEYNTILIGDFVGQFDSSQTDELWT